MIRNCCSLEVLRKMRVLFHLASPITPNIKAYRAKKAMPRCSCDQQTRLGSSSTNLNGVGKKSEFRRQIKFGTTWFLRANPVSLEYSQLKMAKKLSMKVMNSVFESTETANFQLTRSENCDEHSSPLARVDKLEISPMLYRLSLITSSSRGGALDTKYLRKHCEY